MFSHPARILSVANVTPPQKYTQEEFLHLLPCVHPIVEKLITSSHIKTRHLFLPPPNKNGKLRFETQADLIKKHRKGSLQIGSDAILKVLFHAGLGVEDVDYLCCTTSTGFMSPGLSAMFIHHLNFRPDCQRVDIVGMGCNAGLNGMNAVVNWANANPGKSALLLCCEVNTAIYAQDEYIGTWIVNSLFGDGAAAIVVRSEPDDGNVLAPGVFGFQSHIMPEHWDSMRFDWNEEHGNWSFFLSKQIPFIIGENAKIPVGQILHRFGLKQEDISHWIVHTGGPALVKALQTNLNLNDKDMRHTISVLRDFGNVSSGSFLFSFNRLVEEGCVERGDYGIMLTMGPGATIETALIRW